jgi:hypothetical protein
MQKKHISSTPFKGSKQQLEMSADIREYIDLKFQGSYCEQVTTLVLSTCIIE